MDIVRRNTIRFVARFEDASGGAATATSAKLNVWYLDLTGTRAHVTLDMAPTSVPGEWAVNWSTAGATPGPVEWAAWSEGPLQGAAQGSFNLIANKANLQ